MMDDRNYNQKGEAVNNQTGAAADSGGTGSYHLPPANEYRPFSEREANSTYYNNATNAPQSTWGYPYTPNNAPQTAYPYSNSNTQPFGNAYAPVAPTPQPAHVNNRSRRKGGWLQVWAAATLLLLALVGALVFMLLTSSNNTGSTTNSLANTASVAAAPTSGAAPVLASTSSSNSQGLLSVAQVAAQVRPAVVQITTSQQQSSINPNDPFGGLGSGSSSSGSVQTGVGSGVIYDKSGLILTNYHVVTGADSLLVSLPDGRSFNGTVVGSDSQTDLAVVKIDPKGASLPIAQLGDASQLQVGDGVVAIGNALALPGGPTVTSGVVSALNRSVTEPASQQGSPALGGTQTSGPQLYGMIQTDAAINPGNSGGALVDMHGRVIGINTLVAGQAEPGLQAQGIGFAISINEVKTIAQQLVTSGKVVHPFLGVAYQTLNPALANRLKVNLTQGDVIMQVQTGSPAAQAGLKAGDVITSIGGQKIADESTLGETINKDKPGDKVTLEIVSPQANGGNGQTRSVQVTLGTRPANS